MNGNEQAQTEESAALLQLLAMSVADVEAGRVRDSDGLCRCTPYYCGNAQKIRIICQPHRLPLRPVRLLKHHVFGHNDIELVAGPYFQGRLDIQVFLQKLHGSLAHLGCQGRTHFILQGGGAVHAPSAGRAKSIH